MTEYLTDNDGNTLRCAGCKMPAVRMIPGADGKPEPVCFTEEEGQLAVRMWFDTLTRSGIVNNPDIL